MKKSITKHFIFLFTLIFASCSNLFTSQESLPSNTKIHFTGTLCITGALPASLNQVQGDSVASRSALPSITPGLDYYYYVTATQTDGSGTFNINSINDSGSFNTSSDVTFALELTTGKWNIECGIKKAASSGVVSGNDVTVMSDTYPAPLTSANPVLNHTFYPKPSQSGSGSLELTFTYDNGTVDSVIVKCGSDEWTRSSSSATQWTVSEDSIDSGTYDVNIYFYKNDSNSNPILVYSTTQTINIFDDMKTNTWVSDGSRVIDSDGNFKLSSALITEYARTTFYVGDTGVGKEPSDTEGTGSPYTPLETVTKALEIIKANGDSSKDYRIFVSGTVPGAKTVLAPAKSLTIQGLNGSDENGNPKDTIDGSLEGSPDTDNTLYLHAQYPVFIKNLTITGNSEKNGIYYQTYSNDKKTLTLESGTYITGNKNGAKILNAKVVIKSGALISQNKRGVYASTGGELVIKEGAVITLNKGEANGAGIFCESGSSLEVQGGEISYNEASGNGGGINSSYCSFTMTGGLVKGNKARSGGGIYTNNTGNSISGGTITENEATVQGGGIYADYNLLLTGVEISLNKSALAGAVAAYRDSLTLGENVYIPWGAKNENGTLVKAAGMNDLGIVDGGGLPNEYIIIGANLSKHSKEDPIALTSYEWKRGKTVIQADTNVTDLTSYKDYFTYTQDGWESKVSTDKKSISIDAPIYVAGQTNHPYCGVAGNDTNGNGTKAKPFATIAKAIELLTDKDTDYTIYIDGTVTGVQTIPDTLKSDETGTYKAKSLTIDGVNGLDTNEEPKDVLDGNKNGTTLTINSSVPVTITNLKITGGNGSNGGGLSVSSSSTVKLLDGTLITGNEATEGGGVYNQGSLYMSGSAMVGKSTNSIATSSSYGNKATESGAGIYSISGAKLYLGYTSWTSTSVNSPSELTGGVCGNYLSNSSSSSAYGGGIFNVGQLYIDSGNISYNYSINGAGIYTESDITMTGGTIKGNEGNSSGVGGGVCVYNEKTFTMSGDSKILDNKNMKFGAGIYLYYNNCKLVMKGGEISGNIAETHGGAVYIHDLSSSNHSDMQISGSSYIPYGGAVNNNDIFMLDFNAKIKITGSLSDRQANNLIYITPNTYTNGKTILEAGTGVTLADAAGKFALTPNENDPTAGWFISSEGTLSTPMNAELVTSENYDTVTRIKVTSATGMNQIATLSNAGKTFEGKTIILFDDVTLNSNFTPIGGGSYDTAFKGTFDGNNKTVSGLSGQIALFNYVGSNIDEGTVKDLTVVGSSTQAGIVNRLNKGRIEGCRSYVSVTHTGSSDTGGIAAFCLSGTIINCVNYGTVKSSGNRLGGILGSMQGSCVVDSCVNKGAVQSTGASKTGGIVGHVYGTVRNCINTGEVSSSTAVVGGIAGDEDCSGTNRGVLNCANLAPVSGTYRVGGIAGACDVSDEYNAIVKNCFTAGNVSITDSSKTSVGGVIGEILTGGSGTCILASNYYKTGTAASGIGVTNDVSVENPRAMVPSIDQMNEWVNANNSGNIYKTWTTKVVAGVTHPVPDVGYNW